MTHLTLKPSTYLTYFVFLFRPKTWPTPTFKAQNLLDTRIKAQNLHSKPQTCLTIASKFGTLPKPTFKAQNLLDNHIQSPKPAQYPYQCSKPSRHSHSKTRTCLTPAFMSDTHPMHGIESTSIIEIGNCLVNVEEAIVLV